MVYIAYCYYICVHYDNCFVLFVCLEDARMQARGENGPVGKGMLINMFK